MLFEHFALNVPAPRAMAAWYCEHLGFRIARDVGGPHHTLFLADRTGRTVMELYANVTAPVPDYAAQHPLVFHFALATRDARSDAERLCAAGACLVDKVTPPDGSLLLMLRDPWGVAIQLCQRAALLPTG